MPSYRIVFERTAEYEIWFEADSPEEATKKFEDYEEALTEEIEIQGISQRILKIESEDE
jgi:hypothetical protein